MLTQTVLERALGERIRTRRREPRAVVTSGSLPNGNGFLSSGGDDDDDDEDDDYAQPPSPDLVRKVRALLYFAKDENASRDIVDTVAELLGRDSVPDRLTIDTDTLPELVECAQSLRQQLRESWL